MSRARPKRVLENVPEDDEAGWAPGAAFAEGGLHIPFDDPSTSTQEAENHRRQSVAALQKAGNVRSRLAAFEANLRLEPVEEVEVRKSWRPTWKKPKKDSPEAAPSPRNPITKSFAALRKSVPDHTAAAPLSDAKTPLRSSTGNLTPRAREASPFMKTVQGFLALRRSSGSGLSVSSQASPKEPETSSPDAFSPLGSGLSTAVNAELAAAATTETAEASSPAGAGDTLEQAQGNVPVCSPNPAAAGKAGVGMQGSLAARLACEAAAQARKKAPDPAAAAAAEPSEASSSVASTHAGAEAAQAASQVQITEAPLMMTVGAAEPMARRKGARSPRGPAPARPEAAQEGAAACSAGVTPMHPPSAAPKPAGAAPADALDAAAAPAPALAPDEVADDHAAVSAGHGSALVNQAIGDRLEGGKAADQQAAAPATPLPNQPGSPAGATSASVCIGSALTPLDIPDSDNNIATPEGSSSAQQLSPLLMSIKKLVSHQAAVESEASPVATPAAETSSAGMTADSIEDAEQLPAPVFSSSPSPVAQGPHSRWGTMLEAGDVSEAIISPILGSTELRSAVAAAQARAVADVDADAPQEQQAEGHSELSQLPDTPAQQVTPAQQASLAPADGKSGNLQERDAVPELEPSVSEGDASATVIQDCMESSGGSLAAEEQPHISQAPAEKSASPGANNAAEVKAQGQDAGSEESKSAGSHSAALQERPSALSIDLNASSNPAQPESGGIGPAQHAGAAASLFHSLASPNRFLEGSQSPELHARMSPGTPAAVTLQPAEVLSLGSRAASAESAALQKASDSCLSPAATEPEEALTPASQQAEAAARSETPAQALPPTGSLGAQLQKLDSGDLDDASSATETASIADSDAPSEAALFSTGEHVGGPQAVPTVDSPQAYATPEQGQIRRSSRTPERELQHSAGSPVSPPQRPALNDGAPFTAAAALMLRSPGARHSPLSPRSRLSPRSMPPLPHSRLFAVSPRSSSSPELDSPLEEAVEELINATCNLEDVQVPPSTGKKAGSADGLVTGEGDCPTPLSMLLPMPTAHSMPMPAGSPAPGILFGQHVQPLSPFPMGDSPAVGTGYTAPQKTPAAATASGLGSSRHFSMTPSPYQSAESAGSVRLIREEGHMASSPPAEAPGVQDLLAAFRRAVGQHRAPPASPAPVLPDTPGSLADSPDNAASSPGVAAYRAEQALPETPEAADQRFSGTEESAWTDGHTQNRHVAGDESSLEEEAATAAGVAHTLQDDRADKISLPSVDASDGKTADPLVAELPSSSEAVQEAASAAAPALPARYFDTEAALPAASHTEQAAKGPIATDTVEEPLLQTHAPEAPLQEERGAGPLMPQSAASPPAGEAAAAEASASQETVLQERLSGEDSGLATELEKSPSKASRESLSPRKTGRTSRPQRLRVVDAENVPSPPGSPGQPGSSGSRAALSPSKLAQKPSSPGSQLRSPLAQRPLQPLSPAQAPNAQSAASDEVEHLHIITPAPAEAPQGSSVGVQLAVTPATAPRAANPAAFLRNTNSIFSPDMPTEAGAPNRQGEPQSPAPEQAEGSTEDLDAKFNLAQFSPPAARRLSTGQTPPLPAAMARSGSQPPSSKRTAEAAQQQPGQRQLRVTFDTQDSPRQGFGSAPDESRAADLPTPVRGPNPGDEHYVEPESPVFDEAFALDAQLILGSLVTPATAARPPAQRLAGPAVPIQEELPDVALPSQKACEIVEEAAAEAGLIKEDTARLVKVMGHFLDALMSELSESEAQRSVLDLATQELRQKCDVLIDENRQLRKDLQEQETEMFKVREDHANTEQQFKTLYRSKYLPLKEEVQECRQDIARLKACRAADAESCEKWRAQVATQQLQIRKADTDAEANSVKIRSLQAELHAATAAAAKAAALQQEADRAALQAAKKASKLEDQLRAAKAEQEVLITQSEEASARVAAAQAARDRAVKEGYAKEEESFSLKKRLQEFKRENDKFADIKAQLKGQVAQLQDSLAKKEEENQNLLAACEQLVTEREAARSEAPA